MEFERTRRRLAWGRRTSCIIIKTLCYLGAGIFLGLMAATMIPCDEVTSSLPAPGNNAYPKATAPELISKVVLPAVVPPARKGVVRPDSREIKTPAMPTDIRKKARPPPNQPLKVGATAESPNSKSAATRNEECEKQLEKNSKYALRSNQFASSHMDQTRKHICAEAAQIPRMKPKRVALFMGALNIFHMDGSGKSARGDLMQWIEMVPCRYDSRLWVVKCCMYGTTRSSLCPRTFMTLIFSYLTTLHWPQVCLR